MKNWIVRATATMDVTMEICITAETESDAVRQAESMNPFDWIQSQSAPDIKLIYAEEE